nr:hypothetical protein [Pandoravirus massiliensis]
MFQLVRGKNTTVIATRKKGERHRKEAPCMQRWAPFWGRCVSTHQKILFRQKKAVHLLRRHFFVDSAWHPSLFYFLLLFYSSSSGALSTSCANRGAKKGREKNQGVPTTPACCKIQPPHSQKGQGPAVKPPLFFRWWLPQVSTRRKFACLAGRTQPGHRRVPPIFHVDTKRAVSAWKRRARHAKLTFYDFILPPLRVQGL